MNKVLLATWVVITKSHNTIHYETIIEKFIIAFQPTNFETPLN